MNDEASYRGNGKQPSQRKMNGPFGNNVGKSVLRFTGDTMDRRNFLRCAGSTVAVLAAHARGEEPPIKDLAEQLDAIRKEHGLPGIAAAIARGKEVISEGVAG